MPNNNVSNTYTAPVLNSAGNTLSLNSSSSPASVTVSSVSLQAGTLLIGSGSTLTVNGSFTNNDTVQMSGGTLSVGGSLTSNGVIVGAGTISGAGSLTNTAHIGAEGLLDLSGINVTNLSGGTLTGGHWHAGDSIVGDSAGTLKLPGDIVTNSASLTIQDAGSQVLDAANHNALAGFTSNQGGDFSVINGASFTSGGSFTNNNNSQLGSATLGIGGSSLTISGNLTNSNNSTVEATGGAAGGASVTITGALSNDGTSTVQIQNGGTLSAASVSNSGQFLTGNAAGDTGNNTVNVAGTFTNTSTGVLNLEESGDQVTVGTLSNAGAVTIGTGATLNVANASLSSITNSATINIAGTLSFSGNTNQAQLSGGGTINLEGGSLTWASGMALDNADNSITGNGTIGNGTTGSNPFTNAGSITPTGTITIMSDLNDDGPITIGSGDTLTVNGATGIGEDNSATATVNGGTLNAKMFMNVGVASGGTGTLLIENAGTGSVTGDLDIGRAGSTGIVTVTGASSTLGVGGRLFVGAGGTGTLNILAGGVTTSGAGSVGVSGSIGTATVSGTGSTWNDTGALTVGSGGSLTAQSGGAVALSGATFTNSGSVTAGAGGKIGGVGAYNQNAGSTTVAGNLSAASYTQTLGTTTVQNGGQVSITGNYSQSGGTTNIQVGGSTLAATFMVNGGSATVDGSLAVTSSASDAVKVGNGGTLYGTGGTITGSLTNDGVIQPGNIGTVGTLSVTGDYTQASDGTFVEQIGGASDYSVLSVTGNVSLDGTLDIVLLGGYTLASDRSSPSSIQPMFPACSQA